MHAGIMRVEEKHDGASGGEDGEYPGTPGGFERALRPENFNDAETEKNDSERLVLQDFQIASDANPPIFGAEGPELGITENKNENSGQQEAKWPGVLDGGPAIFQSFTGKNKKSSENDENASKVMIEFAFFFVGKKFGLLGGIIGAVHGHGHARVIVLMRLGVRNCRNEAGKNHSKKRQQESNLEFRKRNHAGSLHKKLVRTWLSWQPFPSK